MDIRGIPARAKEADNEERCETTEEGAVRATKNRNARRNAIPYEQGPSHYHTPIGKRNSACNTEKHRRLVKRARRCAYLRVSHIWFAIFVGSYADRSYSSTPCTSSSKRQKVRFTPSDFSVSDAAFVLGSFSSAFCIAPAAFTALHLYGCVRCISDGVSRRAKSASEDYSWPTSAPDGNSALYYSGRWAFRSVIPPVSREIATQSALAKCPNISRFWGDLGGNSPHYTLGRGEFGSVIPPDRSKFGGLNVQNGPILLIAGMVSGCRRRGVSRGNRR